jgi:hypothetical protein
MPETIAPPHFLLSALLWPHRAGGSSGVLRGVILVALGTALLTLSAKVNLPLPYVPMTLQTLAVLVIGAAYSIWPKARWDCRYSRVRSVDLRRCSGRRPDISSASWLRPS